MSSIIKVNTFQDANGNALFSSDGSGNVTLSSSDMKMTPAFLVDRTSSNQQINDETYTTIQFNNVLLDTDSGYSTSTYKYTIPKTGKYFIFANVYGVSPNNTDGLERYYLRLLKNSDDAIAETFYDMRNNPGYQITNTIQHIENLSANDTIYVHAFIDVVNNVSDPEIGGSSNRSISSFGAYRIIGA